MSPVSLVLIFRERNFRTRGVYTAFAGLRGDRKYSEFRQTGSNFVNWPRLKTATWSESKYDRILEDIFDVQDEIVRRITLALIGEIELSSLKRAKRKPTENMTSYELLLRGKEMHHRFEKSAYQQALKLFDQAIQADESNAQAYAWKACTIGQGMGRGYLEGTFQEAATECMDMLNKAISYNENDFECHRLFAEIYLSTHEFERM